MSICPPRQADTSGLINDIMASLLLPVLISLTRSADRPSPCPAVCCSRPRFSPLVIFYCFQSHFPLLLLPLCSPHFSSTSILLLFFFLLPFFSISNFVSLWSCVLCIFYPSRSSLLIFTWHSASGHMCRTTVWNMVLDAPVCFHDSMIKHTCLCTIHLILWTGSYMLISVIEDSVLELIQSLRWTVAHTFSGIKKITVQL